MRSAMASILPGSESEGSTLSASKRERLRAAIEHGIHYLPTQGPISVFVHHNTLHAFEDLPFEQAVLKGGELYGCEPYLSEDQYREEFQRGRISIDHLRQIMMDDLGDQADELIASFGTRYTLRLAMLQMTLHTASDAELRWLLAETDLLTRFRDEVTPHRREELISLTRRWVLQQVEAEDGRSAVAAGEIPSGPLPAVAESLLNEMGRHKVQSWPSEKWETFTLRLLWKLCRQGVLSADVPPADQRATVRPRDYLWQATGQDSDRLVNEVLIRFCGVFLDQGFSDWPLPDREQGFAKSFAKLYLRPMTILPAWMEGIRKDLHQLAVGSFDALDCVAQSLTAFGLEEQEWEEFVGQSLLSLRGWAGMLWQTESKTPMLPKPLPSGSLDEYLAVRLLLERQAVSYLGKQWLGTSDLREIRQRVGDVVPATSVPSRGQQTYTIFQLAQVCGWTAKQLLSMTRPQWMCLVREVEAFPSLERRRILHLGYERQYRNATLDALATHSRRRAEQLKKVNKRRAAFHASFCIDDREESFRRHLEEVDPECETSSAAGFFAVAIYYQGADHANYRPLCPAIITPKHYIREEPLFSETATNDKRTQRRRRLGQLTHQLHSSSRTLVGGWLTGIFGAVATVPMVARILAPHLTSRIRDSFGMLVRPPATELRIERTAAEPGPEPEARGYSLEEMSAIVLRILQDTGLVENLPRIILFVGHGSSSLNNPHESAYSCGACSGGRGGPNARTFCLMANDPRVRRLVAESGLEIPEDVRFVGAFHDTCTDEVEYFDLDLLPYSHRQGFLRMQASIDVARARNAHERARRFELVPCDLTPSQALASVEERAEDLSQARPEYNHASNAVTVVGRRDWTRGLFMDRRVFLTSYNPAIDDEHSTVLTRILQAAIPVCAGINLEYYFSTVDNEGYGCGSKLPHNVSSMVGVMTGAASDLRPGLSQQMVEIHEPIRCLFVIETTAEKMFAILDANPGIARLVHGEWVLLALIDAETSHLQIYRDGRFEDYVPETTDLPQVDSSIDWYRGRRDHLGYASIVEYGA